MMTKRPSWTILSLLTILLLALGTAACGGEDAAGDHVHGEDTHTHEGEDAHAATAADTAGTYVDTTGAFFDETPPQTGETDEDAHVHGEETHTHD